MLDHSQNRAPSGRSFAPWLAALLACSVAACAAPQAKHEMSWPLPPNKPRLRYVESIVGPSTFDTGLWRRIRRALVGADYANNVFNPAGLALSADESRLYVTCPTVSRVLEFDFVRGAVRGVATDGPGRPSAPYGIATDAQDRLYVGDQKEAAVWVYDHRGAFQLLVGKGRLVRPTGVAVDSRRQVLYVVDGGTRESPRHVVEVFGFDGRHLRTIGSQGGEPGQFLYPGFATVGPDGNLYVADTLNSRIQIFDPEGALVGLFGSLGDLPGQFGKPKSIALDAQRNLHVVDGQLARVQILDPQLRVLMMYGGQSPLPPYLWLPNGIAINSKNEIFIADYSANRINKYLLYDTSPPEDAKPEQGKPDASPPPPTDGKDEPGEEGSPQRDMPQGGRKDAGARLHRPDIPSFSSLLAGM